jgi:hypothetical protein
MPQQLPIIFNLQRNATQRNATQRNALCADNKPLTLFSFSTQGNNAVGLALILINKTNNK